MIAIEDGITTGGVTISLYGEHLSMIRSNRRRGRVRKYHSRPFFSDIFTPGYSVTEVMVYGRGMVCLKPYIYSITSF